MSLVSTIVSLGTDFATTIFLVTDNCLQPSRVVTQLFEIVAVATFVGKAAGLLSGHRRAHDVALAQHPQLVV